MNHFKDTSAQKEHVSKSHGTTIGLTCRKLYKVTFEIVILAYGTSQQGINPMGKCSHQTHQTDHRNESQWTLLDHYQNPKDRI